MKLRHIKTDRCPFCGDTTVVAETLGHSPWSHELVVHVNGEQFEHREFRCGLIVSWSPNFSKELLADDPGGHCENSDDSKRLRERRDALREKLQKVIDESDADDAFKLRKSDHLKGDW